MPAPRARQLRTGRGDPAQAHYIANPPLAGIAGVMGVVAVLLLASYPLKQHAVTIDLPFPSSQPDTRLGLSIDLVTVERDDTIRWNGEAIALSALPGILKARNRRDDSAGLRFSPAGDARYATVLRVLAVLKAGGAAEGGFCFDGHHKFRHFGKAGDTAERLARLPDIPCDPTVDGRLDPPGPYMPTYR